MKVNSGDSLWSIVREKLGENITDAEISEKVNQISVFNNLSNPSEIQVGQNIDLSCLDEFEKEEDQEQKTYELPEQSNNTKASSQTYEVKSGDSMWRIAKNYFGTDTPESELSEKINKLAEFNNISDISNINVGQKIDFSCFNEDEIVKELGETKSEKEKEEELEEEIKEESKELETEEQTSLPEETKPREINKNSQELTGEIEFHRGSPEEYEYETEELKERATEMWTNTQANALRSDSLHRNAPTFNDNGMVTANESFYESEVDGPLSGYTILVNSGHGGFNPAGTSFDPGAVNEEYGAEEWIINQDYAEELTEKLLDQGADVLMNQGQFETLTESINNFADEYGKGNNDNLKLVSLHSNIAGSDSHGIVYFNADGNNDLINHLDNAARKAGLDVNYTGEYNARINKTANNNNIDNALVEIGFMSNPQELNKMLYDEQFKESFVNHIVDGIIESTEE